MDKTDFACNVSLVKRKVGVKSAKLSGLIFWAKTQINGTKYLLPNGRMQFTCVAGNMQGDFFFTIGDLIFQSELCA